MQSNAEVPLLIRAAALADIPEMHRIRLAVRENRLSNPALVQPHHYEVMLRESGRGWVAELDHDIVGFAIADLERSNIWALFVAPEFEGRGIGRQLHDTLLSSLFRAGVDEVWLSTDPGTRAEQFYRNAQWQFDGMEGGEARYTMSRSRWLEHP